MTTSPDPRPEPTAGSRRDFLTHAAAAAGVLGIAPGHAFALGRQNAELGPLPEGRSRGPIAAEDPVRIGVIGTGGMGNGHVGSLIGIGQGDRAHLEVVALSDVCAPRLENSLSGAREKQPGVEVTGYRDYTELLGRDDVDGVLIASPEHWHAKMAVDAITAGKDVYLEKPMTLRLPEALWLQDCMAANPDMRLQVGTQYMMLSKYQKAKELIASGRIGKPTFSQTSYCRNSANGEWLYGIDEQVKPGDMIDWKRWCGPLGEREWDTEVYHRWRRYKDYSTGIVGDLLVHMMTPMIYALDAGWPVRVSASGGHYIDQAMENHDQVNITIEFEAGHTMIVAGSTCNEQGLEVMIRGHQANLYLGSNNCKLTPERIFVDDVEAETFECPHVAPQDEMRIDWINSIRTRQANASPVELGTQVMVIVDLATRSMWEGGAFRFDPESRTVTRA